MIVYVIEVGEYSDRYVYTVVETEKLAKQVIEHYRQLHSYGSIECTEMDTERFSNSLKGIKIYDVYYYNYDTNWNVYKHWTVYKQDDDDFCRYPKSTCCEITNVREKYVIYAKSEEQALKIAQDMRMKRLAEEQGL